MYPTSHFIQKGVHNIKLIYNLQDWEWAILFFRNNLQSGLSRIVISISNSFIYTCDLDQFMRDHERLSYILLMGDRYSEYGLRITVHGWRLLFFGKCITKNGSRNIILPLSHHNIFSRRNYLYCSEELVLWRTIYAVTIGARWYHIIYFIHNVSNRN